MKRNYIWKFFKLENDLAICQVPTCDYKIKFSGLTSNLNYHLINSHKIIEETKVKRKTKLLSKNEEIMITRNIIEFLIESNSPFIFLENVFFFKKFIKSFNDLYDIPSKKKAKYLICCSPTTSSVESLFYISGIITENRKNSISSNLLENLILLKEKKRKNFI